MSSEANKDSEQFEMDEEVAVKEKLNPKSELATPSKVKFTAANDSKNGEAKVDVDGRYGGSVGMSKEELMKYANDPFWVRLRMFLFILFWVIWFAMLIGSVVIIAVAPKCPATSSLPWWQKTTIYQVYVRSFKDSDNDGQGDLPGLISKLDYLSDLGIETLILSPIYPSGMADSGYDVTNYTAVDPRYGTLEDFDKLVEEMHKEERNMKVIIDFIPNHTSDRHPWFNASEYNVPEFQDYYVWHNGTPSASGQPGLPNNWKSVFGGPAWAWSDRRKQYYLHQFYKEQPDLNLRNPEVRKALKEVLQFWLRHKVDGIRIDAVSHLIEDENFANEDPNTGANVGSDHYESLNHNKTKAQEENYELLKEWRKTVKKTGLKRILISEAYEPTGQLLKYYGASEDPIIDLPFNFNLIDVNSNTKANELKETIESWISATDGLNWPPNSKPPGPWSAWVIDNHDKPRLAKRLGEALSDAISMLTFILPRNTPVVYYGDEIGMTGNTDIPSKSISEGNPDRLQSRSPMQWNKETSSAGFSDNGVQSWLNVDKDYTEHNVETQLKENQTSHLKIFKSLVQLRKTGSESIVLGQTKFPAINSSDNVLIISRLSEGHNGYVLAINLNPNSKKTVRLNEPYLPEKGTVFLTDSHHSAEVVGTEIKFSEFILQPTQSLLIEFSPPE